MKKLFFYVMVAALFTACSCPVHQEGEATATDSTEMATAEETIAEALALPTILADADQYIGKQISVFGLVNHVCKHGGKKLVMGGKIDPSIRLKVFATEESGDFMADQLVDEIVLVNGTLNAKIIDSAYIAEKEAKLESLKALEANGATEEEIATECLKGKEGARKCCAKKDAEKKTCSADQHKEHGKTCATEGKTCIETFESRIAHLKEKLEAARAEGKEHLAYYSLKCSSYTIMENQDEEREEPEFDISEEQIEEAAAE